MSKFTIFLWFCFAVLVGHAFGFRHGVESSDYDRVHANQKLQHCLSAIYDKK
jgi:hypothetical protein